MRKASQKTLKNEIENLRAHAGEMSFIAHAPAKDRNALLASAPKGLVNALSTAVRLAHEHGAKFPKAHKNRAAKLMSRNSAARTKEWAVRGRSGKSSRGGGFFQDVAHFFENIVKPVADTVKTVAPLIALAA